MTSRPASVLLRAVALGSTRWCRARSTSARVIVASARARTAPERGAEHPGVRTRRVVAASASSTSSRGGGGASSSLARLLPRASARFFIRAAAPSPSVAATATARAFAPASFRGARRVGARFSADAAARAAAGDHDDDDEIDDDDDETDDDDDDDEFDDGLDDPFAHVAAPPIADDHPGLAGSDAEFEKMLDEMMADGEPDDDAATDGDGDGDPDEQVDGAAAKYSEPGDAAPWPSDGSWPEWDAFLALLLERGYDPESPKEKALLAGGGGGGDGGEEGLSTPEWARKVAAESSESNADSASASEDSDSIDGLDDPFAKIVASSEDGDGDGDSSSSSSSYEEGGVLSYANKKRLILEWSRDRDDIFHRCPEREMYQICDHPLPRENNAGGRKQINALKRMRAYLGIDDGDLRGKCAAADSDVSVSLRAGTTDLGRVLMTYAVDVTDPSGAFSLHWCPYDRVRAVNADP